MMSMGRRKLLCATTRTRTEVQCNDPDDRPFLAEKQLVGMSALQIRDI